MKLRIATPTKAFIEQIEPDELERLIRALSYTNTAAAHDVKRHINNKWLRIGNPEAWAAKYEKLKKLVKNTLVFEENGKKYIRPGSIPYLTNFAIESTSEVKYPALKRVAWAKLLPFTLHDYQDITADRLQKVFHGNGELCTGSGKTAIILKLCREMGLRTAVIAPSQSIFRELLEKMEFHLGKGQVGTFGDNKKKLDRRFTVCIGDSLANVKPGTPEWEFFSHLDVIMVDESHLWGAESLEDVCHGVFADVPYRFFFSGTQTRGDGAEKLLQSIIGQTVYTLTTEEAVRKGYICAHDYAIVDIESSNPNMTSPDIIEMKRIHFLRNRNVAAFAAALANAQALAHGQQTLILVEELGQIAMLIPLLKVPYAYAHSDRNTKRLAEIGLEKVDSKKSVEAFNKNEVKVLIGTSCIATGTNIYPMRHTINWVGGTSEIKTKQGAIGRSVRLHKQNPWAAKCKEKTCTTIWDFSIYDVFAMTEQLDDRIAYYRESGSNIRRIRLPR